MAMLESVLEIRKKELRCFEKKQADVHSGDAALVSYSAAVEVVELAISFSALCAASTGPHRRSKA